MSEFDFNTLLHDIENESINKNDWIKGHSDPANVIDPTQQTNGTAEVKYGERGGKEIRSLVLPPVDYYQRDGHISKAQHHVARRLYALWYVGGLRRDVAAAQISDLQVYGSIAPLSRIDAWELYRAAVDSIKPEPVRIVTLSVVCWEELAGRGNMSLLRDGLDDLIKHFDLAEKK